MNAKISAFVICVEAAIYLLLYNFHDYTFKLNYDAVFLENWTFYGLILFQQNNLGLEQSETIKNAKDIKGVFRTPSNIYDAAFLQR